MTLPTDRSARESAGRRLVLVELNEINFDVARDYVERLDLRSFRRLLQGCARRTYAESRYEQLEPWIQWVSAHTGMDAGQHGVFRLGDIVGSGVPQIFEQLEAQGLRVGCVSAMNAENRLRRPAYFIPDPWTPTPSDGSFWSRSLAAAVSQAVNDNAHGRLTFGSKLALGAGLLRFANPRHWGLYADLARRSRGAPWRKALFLDLFLHDLHMALLRRHRPDFSTVFLNAGAHIQHHYFLNARSVGAGGPRNPPWYVSQDVDPVGEMLQLYDRLVGELLALPDTDLLIATGLSQQPYDRVKYYWRLRDHADFLRRIGVQFSSVEPRMTRDFLIRFESAEQAFGAQQMLASVRVEGSVTPVFGDIDNRGDSLFATLSWPEDVPAELHVTAAGRRIALRPHVAFVAIKNGMHRSVGYAFFHGDVARHAPEEGAHVAALYQTIRRYFVSPAVMARPAGVQLQAEASR
jgi:hypothetical protein